MALDPRSLPGDALAWLAQHRYATLTTLRPDGSPHVVPVAMTYDPATATARVLARRHSVKAANVRAGSPAVLCEVDGGRWLTLEGEARVTDHPAALAEAERRYAERFRAPTPNPERVVLEISVTRCLGARQLTRPPVVPSAE